MVVGDVWFRITMCVFERFSSWSLAMLLVLSLGACGNQPHDARHADRSLSSETIFSPNGEPLNGGPLGYPSCPSAMTAWFNRVDTNHDQRIDLDEYLADAQRQFRVMDLNHDGEITPTELAAYRAPYNVQIAESAPPDEAAERDDYARQMRERESNAANGASHSAPARRVDLANDTADPVMAADTHLKFRVSRDDFLAYEKTQFVQLDAHHDGELTLAEILTLCPNSQSRH